MSKKGTEVDPLRVAMRPPAEIAAIPPAPSSPRGIARLVIATGLASLVVFQIWEIVDRHLPDISATAQLITGVRGISSSLFTALVVAVVALWQHRRHTAVLESRIDALTQAGEASRSFLDLIFDASPASLGLREWGRGFTYSSADQDFRGDLSC